MFVECEFVLCSISRICARSRCRLILDDLSFYHTRNAFIRCSIVHRGHTHTYKKTHTFSMADALHFFFLSPARARKKRTNKNVVLNIVLIYQKSLKSQLKNLCARLKSIRMGESIHSHSHTAMRKLDSQINKIQMNLRKKKIWKKRWRKCNGNGNGLYEYLELLRSSHHNWCCSHRSLPFLSSLYNVHTTSFFIFFCINFSDLNYFHFVHFQFKR